MKPEVGVCVSANPFKPGDIVRLKSGGPLMTVTTIVGWDTNCTWFPVTALVAPFELYAFPGAITLPFQALELATKPS
jgi:uncharacterized protein YodC (DUF2158 family)